MSEENKALFRRFVDDVINNRNFGAPNISHFAIQGTSGGILSLFNGDLVRNVNFYSGGIFFHVHLSTCFYIMSHYMT